MIKSMTGFGRAEGLAGGKRVTVDIKSLNSRQLDLSLRLPSLYREKDVLLRSLCAEHIIRGKSELSISISSEEEQNKLGFNEPLIAQYFSDLKRIGDNAGAVGTDYFSLAMKLPEVMKTTSTELEDSEWQGVLAIVKEAVTAFNSFRDQEGQSLAEDFSLRVKNIEDRMDAISEFEEARTEKVKERLQKKLDELQLGDKIDNNRLEQEMIYFLEKLDITEEKVRLRTHCDYFRQTMNEDGGNGKKLGFIAQEFGREINTIGSKANDANIQKLVVQMKDELEKIKEQMLNVL